MQLPSNNSHPRSIHSNGSRGEGDALGSSPQVMRSPTSVTPSKATATSKLNGATISNPERTAGRKLYIVGGNEMSGSISKSKDNIKWKADGAAEWTEDISRYRHSNPMSPQTQKDASSKSTLILKSKDKASLPNSPLPEPPAQFLEETGNNTHNPAASTKPSASDLTVRSAEDYCNNRGWEKFLCPELMRIDASEFARPKEAVAKDCTYRTTIRPNFRPVIGRPAKLSGFERLPAEIRWQIYGYLVKDYRVEICRTRYVQCETPKKYSYRIFHRQLWLRNKKTQKAFFGIQKLPSWHPPLPFNLLFTCRVMYRDLLCLLYSNTQFVFNSTYTIKRFLDTTSKDAQAAIHHVELNHIMYLEPRLAKFRCYKARSDFAFWKACDAMTLSFTSLKVLHVDLRIGDWPIMLHLGERWAWPLQFFGGHGDGRVGNLQWAEVKLRVDQYSPEQIKRVEQKLEEAMMDPTAYQLREDERLARELDKLNGPVKASKILKIVF